MTIREYGVVLFGATGFTGKLVAEYLARTAPKDLPWAIAGRNRAKLESVKKELVAIDSALAGLPIVIADGHDEASLDALVPRTRVVCTTVGPFAKYGKKLVSACARHGTHYCDITGEVPFIRASIDENHERAQKTGARIVHSCGFDSIPFDLGVHMLWDCAKNDGRSLGLVRGFAGEAKGGFSGGTIASMLALVEEASRDAAVRRLLANPFALDPLPSSPRLSSGVDAEQSSYDADPRGVHYDADIGRWTAPFIMSGVNTRVVRRSHALLGRGYGDNFHYRESMSLPKGPKGFVAASLVTAGLGAFVIGASVAPMRSLLAKILPKAGEGPSKEARDAGYFKVRFLGETEETGGTKARRLVGRVEGTSDPGYGETAKMLGQSALCLAEDASLLPPRFGVLTPATAMGMRLVDRLRAAGMTFAVE